MLGCWSPLLVGKGTGWEEILEDRREKGAEMRGIGLVLIWKAVWVGGGLVPVPGVEVPR
jgi:hypothetical protein